MLAHARIRIWHARNWIWNAMLMWHARIRILSCQKPDSGMPDSGSGIQMTKISSPANAIFGIAGNT